MKARLLVGLLLSLAPALGAAQADRFRAIDRNGDRVISSEEWYGQKGVAPVPFTVIDVNGDGGISEAEFREWSSARGSASARGITSADRFRAIDKNKDGAISAQEWKDGTLSDMPFAAVDANKDGRISPKEFSAWDQRRIPAAEAPAPLPGTAPTSERLRGTTGVPRVQAPPPAASSRSPAPHSPFSTPSVTPSGGIPGSSPNMSSGSGNTTR